MNLPQKKECLSAMIPVEVAGGKVDVLVFFKNRAGLQVTSNFNRYVLSGAEQGLVSVDGTTLGGTILMQYVNDMEIHDELPSGHTFSSVNIFLARLAIMIDDQLKGESGALPVDGFSSIFYVEVVGKDISVDVTWCFESSSWVCNACPDDDTLWVSGHRVFSATYPPPSGLSFLCPDLLSPGAPKTPRGLVFILLPRYIQQPTKVRGLDINLVQS